MMLLCIVEKPIWNNPRHNSVAKDKIYHGDKENERRDIANPKEPKVPNKVLMQANNFLDPITSDPIPIGILKRICPIA